MFLEQASLTEGDLRDLSLVRLTTDRILRMIAEGRARPGQRLIENDLAEQLGIGRSPLREAFRVLVERGILVSRPRRGTFVRSLSAAEIDDIYRARRCIELFGLSCALDEPREATVPGLETALAAMERAVGADDVRAVIAADLDFHTLIVKAGQCARLDEAYARIRFDMSFGLLFAGSCYGDLVAATRDHPPIVAALRSGDPDLAARRLTEHLEDGRRHLRAFFEVSAEE